MKYESFEKTVEYSSANQLLDYCRDQKFVVLGIEGLHREGSNLIPDLNLIAETSQDEDKPWQERVDSSIEAARRFLEEESVSMDDNLLLCFTIKRKLEDHMPS